MGQRWSEDGRWLTRCYSTQEEQGLGWWTLQGESLVISGLRLVRRLTSMQHPWNFERWPSMLTLRMTWFASMAAKEKPLIWWAQQVWLQMPAFAHTGAIMYSRRKNHCECILDHAPHSGTSGSCGWRVASCCQSSQRVYAPVNFAANNAHRAKCHPCRRLLDKVVAIACESAGPQKPAVETHPKLGRAAPLNFEMSMLDCMKLARCPKGLKIGPLDGECV